MSKKVIVFWMLFAVVIGTILGLLLAKFFEFSEYVAIMTLGLFLNCLGCGVLIGYMLIDCGIFTKSSEKRNIFD